MATYAQPFEVSDLVSITAAVPALGITAGLQGVVVRVYQLPGATAYNVSVRVPDDIRGTKDFELAATAVTAV